MLDVTPGAAASIPVSVPAAAPRGNNSSPTVSPVVPELKVFAFRATLGIRSGDPAA